MTFHGIVPALDTRAGARDAQSRDHDRRCCSKQLGFKGLLITDAMDMNGVLSRVTVGPGRLPSATTPATTARSTTRSASAKRASSPIAAGADILLMPSDVPGGDRRRRRRRSRRALHAGARRFVGAPRARDQATARPRPPPPREPRHACARSSATPRTSPSPRSPRAAVDHARQGFARSRSARRHRRSVREFCRSPSRHGPTCPPARRSTPSCGA